MGKKPKNSTKNTVKPTQNQVSDASSLHISELCLEEFEKSLASMLESLSSKKIEILRASAYNSNDDPTTVIGTINAKYLLDDNESIESLQQKIIEATNQNTSLQTKLLNLKSIVHRDTSNSSQDEAPKREIKANQTQKVLPVSGSYQEKDFVPRRNKNVESEPKEYEKQQIVTPRREVPRLSKFERCFSADKKKTTKNYSQVTSWASERDDDFMRIKTDDRSFSKSFSNFKSYQDLVEIKPNVCVKENKRFMIHELSLETILQKIYLEAYSYEDLQEYVVPAIKKITSLDEFFDILYNSIREYSLEAKELIMEGLSQVIIKTKRLVKDNKGGSQIVHEFGGYKKFSKYSGTYVGIIDKIYEVYKSLEITSTEIEKVCTLYIDSFCKQNIQFSCHSFHQRVFAKYFYCDPWVKDFLETISRYFEESQFYASKYPTTVAQLIELADCLKKIKQYEANDQIENIDDDDYDRADDILEGDEIYHDMENVTKGMKGQQDNRMMQQDLIDTDNEDSNKASQISGSNKDTGMKPKKKKNKKKKNKGKNGQKDDEEGKNMLENTADRTPGNKEDRENIQTQIDNKNNLMKGYLKQNTGNFQLDNEVEAFERRLELEVNQSNSKEGKIKPNISDEWVQSLRQRLNKMNKVY